jgi:CO/xanthine dehydrogenase FAD-binding subunit
MTTLRSGELITEIRLPVPEKGSGSAYVAVEHPASGFALAGAAAMVAPGGTSRVAITGVSTAPFVLDGDVQSVDVFSDRFASEEYRRQLARTVARRAVALAEARAKEDGA